MTAFPSPALAPETAQRLLADWDRTHEDLSALIAAHEVREWSREEELRHIDLVRHIAVLSTALHGHHQSAVLTETERAWLEAQGVSQPPVTRPSLVPNQETVEAMKAAERGEVTVAGHPGNLLKSLNGDWAGES